MARIKYSALIEDIRGSIGGTTFQKNAYGYTIKKKPNIIKPNRPTQNRQKALMAQVVKSWRDVGQPVRDVWISWASTYPQYAKHNPASQLSGFAVFVKRNYYRLLDNASIMLSPDFAVPPSDVLSYTITVAAAVMTITITSANDDETWSIPIFISRPFSSGQNFIGTKTRYVITLSNADGSTNVTNQYTALFGALPAVGDRVAFDTVLVDDNSGVVKARTQEIITVI